LLSNDLVIFEVTFKSVRVAASHGPGIEGKAVVVFRDIKVTMDAEKFKLESVVIVCSKETVHFDCRFTT